MGLVRADLVRVGLVRVGRGLSVRRRAMAAWAGQLEQGVEQGHQVQGHLVRGRRVVALHFRAVGEAGSVRIGAELAGPVFRATGTWRSGGRLNASRTRARRGA